MWLRQGLRSLCSALVWVSMEACSSWKQTLLLLCVTLCFPFSDSESMKWYWGGSVIWNLLALLAQITLGEVVWEKMNFLWRNCVLMSSLSILIWPMFSSYSQTLLFPTSSISCFPFWVNTCSVFHVTEPCLLSGPFTFIVCLDSVSLLLYLARGLLSRWVSPLSFTLFKSEKAKSLQSCSIY